MHPWWTGGYQLTGWLCRNHGRIKSLRWSGWCTEVNSNWDNLRYCNNFLRLYPCLRVRIYFHYMLVKHAIGSLTSAKMGRSNRSSTEKAVRPVEWSICVSWATCSILLLYTKTLIYGTHFTRDCTILSATKHEPATQHQRSLAGTHCAYPRRDGQAELTSILCLVTYYRYKCVVLILYTQRMLLNVYEHLQIVTVRWQYNRPVDSVVVRSVGWRRVSSWQVIITLTNLVYIHLS